MLSQFFAEDEIKIFMLNDNYRVYRTDPLRSSRPRRHTSTDTTTRCWQESRRFCVLLSQR